MIIFVELLPKINDTGNESTHLTKILQILTSALNDIIRYTLFYLNSKHTLFPPGWLDMSHLLLSLIDRLFFNGLFISYEITSSIVISMLFFIFIFCYLENNNCNGNAFLFKKNHRIWSNSTHPIRKSRHDTSASSGLFSKHWSSTRQDFSIFNLFSISVLQNIQLCYII